MTKEERQSIVEQLALIKGYNPSAFDNTSDDDLLKELEEYYE